MKDYIWVLKGSKGEPFGAFTSKDALLESLRSAHPEDRRGWSLVRFDNGLMCATDLGSADQFMEANA